MSRSWVRIPPPTPPPAAAGCVGVPQLGAWVRILPVPGTREHPPSHTHTHTHTPVCIFMRTRTLRAALYISFCPACVWVRVPASRTGGNAHKYPLTPVGAHLVNTHVSHLLVHIPSCLRTPPLKPTPPTHMHPHPNSHSSCTPQGHTKMHTQFLAPLCTHSHPYSFGGALGPPPPPTHAVHPSTLPAPWGSHVAPPSTEICGTRTPLWQVYTKIHAHDRGLGSRMMPPHACQRRCPHTAAPASDSGSGSVRTDCDHAADGGDGRALGARWHGGHSPGQLPAHPASAE